MDGAASGHLRGDGPIAGEPASHTRGERLSGSSTGSSAVSPSRSNGRHDYPRVGHAIARNAFLGNKAHCVSLFFMPLNDDNTRHGRDAFGKSTTVEEGATVFSIIGGIAVVKIKPLA